jgi:hypothetical protein
MNQTYWQRFIFKDQVNTTAISNLVVNNQIILDEFLFQFNAYTFLIW